MRLRLQSHLFPNLRLTAYIHGKTTLSEYCICDKKYVKIGRKNSIDKRKLRRAQKLFLTLLNS